MDGSPNKPPPVDVLVELSPTSKPHGPRRVDIPVDVIDVPIEIMPPGGRGPPVARNGHDNSAEVVWRATAISNQRVPAVGSGAAPRDQRPPSPMPAARSGRQVL